MSLRPGAVNFDEKWRDLKQTIDAVVHLRAVKRVRWNDNISYPPITCHNSILGHVEKEVLLLFLENGNCVAVWEVLF